MDVFHNGMCQYSNIQQRLCWIVLGNVLISWQCNFEVKYITSFFQKHHVANNIPMYSSQLLVGR